MTFSASKKEKGDLLQSAEWNALTIEAERLGKDKLDRNQDDTFKGSLTIEGILTAKEKVILKKSLYLQNDSLVIGAEEDEEERNYRLRVNNLDKSDNLAWFDSGEKSSVIALSANNSWKDRVEIANRNNERIAFCTNGRDVLSITKEHRVGIGTDSPSTELHVIGTLTADLFQGVGAFVAGMIIMWHGDENNIPQGWVLCNGDNQTPDLTERFIMGAGNRTKSHDKGEPDFHSHPINIPSKTFETSKAGVHNHNFPTDWFKNNMKDGDGRSGLDTKGTEVCDKTTQDSGEHLHSVTVETYKINSEVYSGENRPRWYALCFIMYKGK